MTAVPDQQTVTPDGKSVQQLIDGVVVRRGVTHVDERGALFELYDPRWGVHPADLVYAYITTTRPGWAKGWGLHHHHDHPARLGQGLGPPSPSRRPLRDLAGSRRARAV